MYGVQVVEGGSQSPFATVSRPPAGLVIFLSTMHRALH